MSRCLCAWCADLIVISWCRLIVVFLPRVFSRNQGRRLVKRVFRPSDQSGTPAAPAAAAAANSSQSQPTEAAAPRPAAALGPGVQDSAL
eukprot:m.107257 g.107257  ORF g.107257 m.107257 type:complete len:89 (+) comp14247_c0_seq6:174-440(+)